MALNATALSALIVAAWNADQVRLKWSSPMSPEQLDMVQALADGVASAVVAHVTSAAVVVGTSVSGGAVTGTVT
jgi:hypothetical protein